MDITHDNVCSSMLSCFYSHLLSTGRPIFSFSLCLLQDEEISMLTEVTHLQEILQHLCLQASDPSSLPTASEQVIRDLKVTGGAGWTYQVNSLFNIYVIDFNAL